MNVSKAPSDGPAVSVIVPTYNRAHLLPRALDSVLAQTFRDFEILVVDDGSTDATAELVEGYAGRDPRVRYLRQPQNAGVSAARNRGLREARGEFIAFLDSDDEWFPDKLSRQTALFRELPARVGLVYCGVESVGDRRSDWTFRPEHRGDVFEAMLLRNVIHTGSGVVIRRLVADTIGGFDEEIPAIEDYDYWLRIARHFDFDFVDDPLFRYFDETGLSRKSLDKEDNHEARAYFFEKHKADMRRADVAHLFLMNSARRHLRSSISDTKSVRRLALAALRDCPTHRPAVWLVVRLSVPAPMKSVFRAAARIARSAGTRTTYTERGLGMRVCIVKNREIKLTETFIRTHIDDLPAEVSVIHGIPPRIEGSRTGRVPLTYKAALGLVRRLSGGRGNVWVKTEPYHYLLKRMRPDIVLAEYGTTGALVWKACERLKTPLVVHFHGYDASRTEILREHAGAYSEMFQQAAAIVAVSRAMRRRLINLGAPPDKVIVNPCSVDLDAFSVSEPDRAPPTFLAVGRLVEKKAPHLLVLAFADVRRECPEARLRIIGDGPLMGVVQDLVSVLGLEDAVDFLGSQPHHVVREEMQRARAFVQHSVTALDGDSEGTPVSVLEASASGLPVVSTDHAGIPDAIQDGKTGYIVAERDVQSMTAQMLRMAREPELAKRLGRNGRERIRALYGRELRMQRLWETLRRSYEGCPLGDLLHDPIDAEKRQAPVLT